MEEHEISVEELAGLAAGWYVVAPNISNGFAAPSLTHEYC